MSYMSGIIIGVDDLYYSVIQSDTKEGFESGPIKKLANTINIGITPNVSNGVLYASNRAVATANALGSIEVEVEIDKLEKEARQEVLGVRKDANGVLRYGKTISAPYITLYFRALLSDKNEDGSDAYRYIQLNKGMFSLDEETYATMGDGVDFQTKTISAQFMPREFDGEWKFEADDNDADITDKTIFENWFVTGYQPPTTP